MTLNCSPLIRKVVRLVRMMRWTSSNVRKHRISPKHRDNPPYVVDSCAICKCSFKLIIDENKFVSNYTVCEDCGVSMLKR
jgi:hypothetical protein